MLYDAGSHNSREDLCSDTLLWTFCQEYVHSLNSCIYKYNYIMDWATLEFSIYCWGYGFEIGWISSFYLLMSNCWTFRHLIIHTGDQLGGDLEEGKESWTMITNRKTLVAGCTNYRAFCAPRLKPAKGTTSFISIFAMLKWTLPVFLIGCM